MTIFKHNEDFGNAPSDTFAADMLQNTPFDGLSPEEGEVIAAVSLAPYYQPIPEYETDSPAVQKFIRSRNQKVKRNPWDRLKAVVDTMSGNKGDWSVLDVGCNIGYFGLTIPKWFPGRVIQYTGIDSDLSCIKAAKALAKYRELDLEFIGGSVFDHVWDMCKAGGHYDVCLFLSLYHHLIGEHGWKLARDVLTVLSSMCKIMIFDMGQKNESNNPSRAYWHDALPDSEHDYLISHEVSNYTNYTNITKIGDSNVGGQGTRRILYRFD